MKPAIKKYNQLLSNIGNVIKTGRDNALSALNEQLLLTYWQIGWQIVEFEQHGNTRAEYGTALIENLSKDLKLKYGRGFSRSNIKLMRLFYLKYPKFKEFDTPEKSQTSGKLTWSHYCELLEVSDDMARTFYNGQCIKENWSVRESRRQIDSALFQRLALSKDKNAVLALVSKNHGIAKAEDLVKDPYVFEFLNVPAGKRISERSLEKKLIDNLQNFLLELGKGFAFVARQFKITLDNTHFHIDLVFYHRILRCFVLIDLKINKVRHKDIGQMNLYLNYFKEEENNECDGDPIGIIIAADKHEYLVKYATGGLSNKIFVSKYQLYLPDKELLEQKVREIIEGD